VRKGVLYISYDGILEPLGQSQVLAYLEKLSKDRPIHLISFEKKSDKDNFKLYDDVKTRIENSNIHWHPLTYHKHPVLLATLWDIVRMLILSYYLVVKFHLKIVHARSYITSLAAVFLKKTLNVYYIFDMRGFWADERVEGGLWDKNSYLFYTFKKLEKIYFLNADVVVSLTNKAVKEVNKFPYLKRGAPIFKVIPTCTDLELFKVGNKRPKESFILGYVGSVGVWYLFEESLKFFKIIKDLIPDARLHIINKGDHDYIYTCLDNLKIQHDDVVVEDTDHKGVVHSMQSMDAGIFIIKPVYSKMASMPTKLGEFLGCGIPCVCNAKVGDMPEIVNDNKVGVVLDDFKELTMIHGAVELLKLLSDVNTSNRCVETAAKYFSLDNGVKSYNDVYQQFDKC
jgi:glycosyltransferase involved in cell wall biosynthesis